MKEQELGLTRLLFRWLFQPRRVRARSSSRGSLLRFTPKGQSSDIRLLLLSKRKHCFRLEKEEMSGYWLEMLDPKQLLRVEEKE